MECLGNNWDNFQKTRKGNNKTLEDVFPVILSDLNITTIYFSVNLYLFHQYDINWSTLLFICFLKVIQEVPLFWKLQL
jgi:hypothetical protein